MGIPGYVFLLLGIILLVRQSKVNVSQFLPFYIFVLVHTYCSLQDKGHYINNEMNNISKIKKTNSKDGKTVFANFGYLSLLQIAGYVFPLITMPYLAHVIGADGFGRIVFASAVVVWIQTKLY